MYSSEEAAQRLRSYHCLEDAAVSQLMAAFGYSAAQLAEHLDQADAEMMAEFERLKSERPELLAISETERRHLEEQAAHEGKSFERVLAAKTVFASRVQAGFAQARRKGKKLRRSDFPTEPKSPPGLDEVPGDLLDSDLKQV